jgi:hypothetical protein
MRGDDRKAEGRRDSPPAGFGRMADFGSGRGEVITIVGKIQIRSRRGDTVFTFYEVLMELSQRSEKTEREMNRLGRPDGRSSPAGLLGRDLGSSSSDTGSERVEGRDGLLPREAGVGDRDTVLEPGRSLGSDRLLALLEVGLDHDSHDLG